MRFDELILSAWVTLILCAGGLIFSSPANSQDQTSEEPQFSSVEERRLHVKIIEEHDSLASIRKELLLKEQMLKTLEDEINSKLDEIDQKLNELEKQKRILLELTSEVDSAEQLRLQNLGKVYQNMIPIQAARALSRLDVETAADILAAMKPRSAAKIINGLSADRASAITRQLIMQKN